MRSFDIRSINVEVLSDIFNIYYNSSREYIKKREIFNPRRYYAYNYRLSRYGHAPQLDIEDTEIIHTRIGLYAYFSRNN
jgi:hypothetical protein